MLVSMLEGSRCERLRIGTKNLLSRDGEKSVSLRDCRHETSERLLLSGICDVKPVVP